jgi:hypothetical protein
MSLSDIFVLACLLTWATLSLRRIAISTRRIAAALEALNELAQKGRGR